MIYNSAIKPTKSNGFSIFIINLCILSTVALQFFLRSGLYSPLRMMLYGIAAVTLLTVIMNKTKREKNSFMSYYVVTIYVAAIAFFIISLYKSQIVTSQLIEFSLPFLMIWLGYKSNLNDIQFKNLLLRYTFLVTLLGIFVIFKYGSGYHIEGGYWYAEKNQVGPFIASVSIILFILLFNKSKENLHVNRLLLIALFIINVANALVIRNRSGLVALGFCIVLFLLSKIKIKKKFSRNSLLAPLIVLALGLIVASGVLDPIYDAIYKSLFLDFDPYDLNSLSANRTDVYASTLEFIGRYPYFGELQVPSYIDATPHNFLLNLWLKYGVVGMLPITVFYIFLWCYVVFKIVVKKQADISLFLVAFMLVISLFEYSYPFGPLTTVSLSWLFLGYSYKNTRSTSASSVDQKTQLTSVTKASA